MELNEIIVVISLTVLFFGFIIWMAIYSRRQGSEELADGNPEINFSEVRKQNKPYLEK